MTKKSSATNKAGPHMIEKLDRRKMLAYLGGAGIGASFLSACGEDTSTGEPPATSPPAPVDMGMVIDREAANYESWRAHLAWHSFVSERRPQVMVRPHTREQVIEAVNFARSNNLRISTKSGGHNYYESWMRQDCLLLDMYNFRHVEVDAASQTAWVEPSVWGSSLLQALRPHGLAFPVSTCLSVPMGGYIMGGGIAYGWQDWGMACHSVLAAEVVLASGEVVEATPENHPDLYWAARGGVAGFPGVILRWKMQCHPDPAVLHMAGNIFPIGRMGEVVDSLQEIALKEIPGWHGQVVVLPTAMAKTVMLSPDKAASVNVDDEYICLMETYTKGDSEAETRKLLADQLTAPVFNESLADIENVGKGLISIYEDIKGREITHVNQICNAFWTAEPKESMNSLAELLIGNTADVAYGALLINGREMGRDDAAFSMGGKGAGSLSVYALWFSDREQGAADWQEKVSDRLSPLSEGRYINETDCFRHPELVAQSYSAENWQKLHQVNGAYDPDGLFLTFPGFESKTENS